MKSKLPRASAMLGLALLSATPAMAADVLSTATYKSSITSDAGGKLDLKMELNYNNANTAMPIAVVMHQFSQSSGNFADYRANAQRLRDQGFFVLTVAMRGRDGSDGVRDTGALEIYDIYDAVEHVKANYGALVNPNNVSITGYSGGGGNVMSAVTKFPDYFRAASSFFGMSDYGYHSTNGWYNNGSSASHKTIMNTDIGNPNTGGATVRDKYMARASNLASINNPYTQIHLFANQNEPTCPIINDTSYRDNAIAGASFAGEFNNIQVHVGNAGTYYDFDGDTVNDPNEQQYWPHQAPTAEQQAAAEQWYVSGLLDGSIAAPTLNTSDTLFVAGYVKTKRFEAWLGNGANAAGTLDYSLGASAYQFALEIQSSDTSVEGWVDIALADRAGTTFNVYLNDVLQSSFVASGNYRFDGLGDGDTLRLQAVPEPSILLAAPFGMLLLRRRSR